MKKNISCPDFRADAFVKDAENGVFSMSLVEQVLAKAFGEVQGDLSQFFNVVNIDDVIVSPDAVAVEPEWRLCNGGTDIIPSGGTIAITGQAKQGKTQLLSIMVSVMLSGGDFGTMRSKKTCGKILWFDTEQEMYHICRNIERMKYLMRNSVAQLPTTYRLKPYTQTERILIITKEVIEKNPDVCVIDGVRDLVMDINDQEQTQKILQWLKVLSEQVPSCTFLLVIHYNPGTNKMRGALGTEITNYASSTFECSVTSAGGRHFVVKQTLTRDAQMPDFAFMFDDKGNLKPYENA